MIVAFDDEKVRAKQPGYVSRYDEFDHDIDYDESRTPGVEPTQVQPGEKPRGPHRPPAHRPQSSEPTRREGFGAGIFE